MCYDNFINTCKILHFFGPKASIHADRLEYYANEMQIRCREYLTETYWDCQFLLGNDTAFMYILMKISYWAFLHLLHNVNNPQSAVAEYGKINHSWIAKCTLIEKRNYMGSGNGSEICNVMLDKSTYLKKSS